MIETYKVTKSELRQSLRKYLDLLLKGNELIIVERKGSRAGVTEETDIIKLIPVDEYEELMQEAYDKGYEDGFESFNEQEANRVKLLREDIEMERMKGL